MAETKPSEQDQGEEHGLEWGLGNPAHALIKLVTKRNLWISGQRIDLLGKYVEGGIGSHLDDNVCN